MKIFNPIILLMLLVYAGAAIAEQRDYAEIEMYPLRIKLSDDGTGIIKNVTCGGCNYKIGKITENTRVYVNNINVDIFRARKRAGTLVLVQFVRSTGEVMEIRWSE